MEIIKIVNDLVRENTYLLVNDQAILVVDPGSNGQDILDAIEAQGKPVVAILLTHTHYDHIMSLDFIRDHCSQPPVYVDEKEASWLMSPADNLSGLDRHSDMEDVIRRPAEHFFQYEENYDLAGFTFKALETPGHSWGGASFLFEAEEFVITGDALFRESVGRTDLPTSNYEDLINGIKNNLFTLPNHFAVHPGHGMNTTIAHEKNFNPHFNQ